MAVIGLYSKRHKAELIPHGLRVQIVHIWDDAIGNPDLNDDREGRIKTLYQCLVGILRREYCVFKLADKTVDPHDSRFAYPELCEFFLLEMDTDRVLDVVEVTARAIDLITRNVQYLNRRRADEIATAAIKELNIRFRENGVAYEYADGQIIRIDSQAIHAETVKPALQVLRDQSFANAQKEFLSAHAHYRHGRFTEALVDCNKAFESTMKIICAKKKWSVSPNATSNELVKVCLA
jgi:hypothetical protein